METLYFVIGAFVAFADKAKAAKVAAGGRQIWAAECRSGEAEVGLLEMEDGAGGTVFYPCAPRAGVVTYRIIR